MKTPLLLAASIIFLTANGLAETEQVHQEQPIFFSITPSAFEHLAQVHESRSQHRTKIVSLILEDKLTAFTDDSRYSIALENLGFQQHETPPPGSTLIMLRGLECYATPELIQLLKNSSVELVYVVGSGRVSDVSALILKTSQPIIAIESKREQNKSEQATPRKPSD
jgi:hypothetical protein